MSRAQVCQVSIQTWWDPTRVGFCLLFILSPLFSAPELDVTYGLLTSEERQAYEKYPGLSAPNKVDDVFLGRSSDHPNKESDKKKTDWKWNNITTPLCLFTSSKKKKVVLTSNSPALLHGDPLI